MNKKMSIHELKMLKLLLEMFLESDGDLPDGRVAKTLTLVTGTLEESQP